MDIFVCTLRFVRVFFWEIYFSLVLGENFDFCGFAKSRLYTMLIARYVRTVLKLNGEQLRLIVLEGFE